jgi:hypothetical protein
VGVEYLGELFGGPQEPSGGITEASEGYEQVSQTPSGIEIRFQVEGHKYQLKIEEETDDDWKDVVSVSKVLSVLDKPALPWWGMKVGVQGTLSLIEDEPTVADLEVDSVVALLNEYKLTVNHVKNRAGDRGSSVHRAFEIWTETGDLPFPDVYPEEERGYITALSKFIEECKPEPLKSEVMVGSLDYGYAGRFDLLAYQGGHEIVTHLTPQKEKRGVIEPGLGLWDLKTSSGVYPETHFRQLEAYECASVECGYGATDFRAVIHVCADGRYEVKVSNATFDDFYHVLRVYEANRRLKGK